MRKTTLELATEIQHETGSIVYLKTEPEQYKRIVSGVLIRQSAISYGLVLGTQETFHDESELSTSKNIQDFM